jgi:hypothetical protein
MDDGPSGTKIVVHSVAREGRWPGTGGLAMQAPGRCQRFETKAHCSQIEEEDECIEEERSRRRWTQKVNHGWNGHRAKAGRHNQVCAPGGRGRNAQDSFDA